MNEPKKYSTGESVANTITHLIGALMALYGTVMLAEASKSLVQATSCAIYGSALILLFISSVCYHSTTNDMARKIFQKIDHSAIYMLIAGTYTPTLILTVRFPLDVILVSIVWILALAGIGFSCINLKSKRLSTTLYLLMGWLSVFFIYHVWMASHLALWLMLGGGLFYSFGCAFYMMKSRYMHSIWHLFVIGGAITHYFAIMELLKAVN